MGFEAVSEDKRSGIKSDPNRQDDEQYIVKLVERIVTVSLSHIVMRRSKAKGEV